MLNLTDPTLAPLIARYRAWVEAENKKCEKLWEDACLETSRQYEVALYEEQERKRCGLPSYPPRRNSPGLFFPNKPTYRSFLDWCIREGIEVPKGEA